MLESLKKRWNVSATGMFLILCTFAIGGSLSGFLAKKVMTLMEVPSAWFYIPLYIVIVTLIWPLAVITVSVFFGQFSFFSKYLRKMGLRMGILKEKKSAEQVG